MRRHSHFMPLAAIVPDKTAPLNLTLTPQPDAQLFCRDRKQVVTELLRSDVGSVTCGATHEFAMVGAVKFPGLVESPREPGHRFSVKGWYSSRLARDVRLRLCGVRLSENR
jgi:hypothetical protein